MPHGRKRPWRLASRLGWRRGNLCSAVIALPQGLAYLAFGLPLVLAPPVRSAYARALRYVEAGRTGGPGPRGAGCLTPRMELSASLRWLGPSALTALAVADLALSYTAALAQRFGADDGAPPAGGVRKGHGSRTADSWRIGRRVAAAAHGGRTRTFVTPFLCLVPLQGRRRAGRGW